MTRGPARVGVVLDLAEEHWPSMDLVGEMILDRLAAEHAADVAATRIQPPFRARFTRWSPARRQARNADRLLNRLRDYPRYLRRLARRGSFDLFHVVDHSYSHLVHELPPGRA